MAGNLPVPQGVSMVILFGTASGTEALVVNHFRNQTSTAIDQAFANSIQTAVNSAFTSSGLQAQIVPSVQYQGVRVRDQSAATNPEFTAVPAGGFTPGTSTGTIPLPANVSICVTHLTGLRGRSYRGRSYLWGFSTDSIAAGGGIADAAATASASFFNSIRVSMSALPNPLILCVLSRFATIPPATTPIERNPPILTTVTASDLKDRRFDTQRRRAIPGV